MWTLSCSISTN